jgi:hypothetical protein
MNKDFHYYGTYSAAYLSGYTHEESLQIARAAFFVDLCTKPVLNSVGAPLAAATTMLAMEMADAGADPISQQDLTRIWSSFHFLPYDLYSTRKGCGKKYMQKYHLICKPNGDLLVETVNQVKGKDLEAAGVAMHVLADTWAHQNFAGTPSRVINDTNYHFYEVLPDGTERKVNFFPNPAVPDDLEKGNYTASMRQGSEISVMNLGHGRAGHLPDYSCMRYKYLPAWADYEEVLKDNPSDFMYAYCQMVYAMKFLRGEIAAFEKAKYADDIVAPHKDKINEIFLKRQTDDCEDWKAFGESLSGQEVPDFETEDYLKEYRAAEGSQKDDTPLGRFILAALAQKSMVTDRVYKSGNLLLGMTGDYKKWGRRGMREYMKLAQEATKGGTL